MGRRCASEKIIAIGELSVLFRYICIAHPDGQNNTRSEYDHKLIQCILCDFSC